MIRQKGATLLLVLVIILLLSLISTIAIRSSILSLGQARQSQLYVQLWQNSDAVLFALEDKKLINQPMAWPAIWVYFQDHQHDQNELVSCYRTTVLALDIQQMGVINDRGKVSSRRGFCQINSSNIKHGRVLSQLYIRKNHHRLPPLMGSPLAMSLGQSHFTNLAQQFEVTVISVVTQSDQQALSNIEGCLQQAQQQAQFCLSQSNARFNVQHAVYGIYGRIG